MPYAVTPRGRVRLSSGIEIGSAYTRPPAPLGTHAEILQGALLRNPRKKHHILHFGGAMKPRRHLPTLTPTTRLGRWIQWLKTWF